MSIGEVPPEVTELLTRLFTECADTHGTAHTYDKGEIYLIDESICSVVFTTTSTVHHILIV